MRTFHDVHLAQQVAYEITGAECRDRGEWWSQAEAAHAAARTAGDAAEAAQPALDLCRRCLSYEGCEIWAQLDNYTGLAAGAAYLNGHRTPTTQVRQQAPPPKHAA